MRRTLLRIGALVTATAAVVVGVSPLLARADAPQQQGWWTDANPGGLPANPASAAADVPDDGLLVQAGPVNPTAPCNCTAFAGLVYELADGTTATDLTLKVAPNSATTPVASLELCGLVNPTLDTEQGGAMADAPDFDCKQHESASLGAGDSSFTFHVGSLVSDGILAVAILPGDSSSRVVLSKPGDSSLATTMSTSSDDFAAGPAPAASSGDGTAPSGSGGGVPPAAEQPAPQLPSQSAVGADAGETPVVAPAPSTAAASPVAVAPVAATSTPSTGPTPVAVLILIAGLALGAALWAMAGRGSVGEPTEA